MRPLRNALAGIAVAMIVLALIDIAFRSTFPRSERLNENFSAAYLRREVAALRSTSPIVVLGDSALWGYRLPADKAAVTLLRRRGLAVENLSFEGGSPPNTYAMLRILSANGVRPRQVVFNVNQKEFNPADSAYQTLHPSVELVGWTALGHGERALLKSTQPAHPDALQHAIESTWALYGMRTDLREALFGDVDAVHALQTAIEGVSGARARRLAAHRPTAQLFEGTYDLTPLDPSNVGFRFLRRIADMLRQQNIPAVAILTPTNHTLLHDYIDSPEYAANLRATRRLLESNGIAVLDLDRAFPASEFLDNDHLTEAGNSRLAAVLRAALR